jgi:hypothetical protein
MHFEMDNSQIKGPRRISIGEGVVSSGQQSNCSLIIVIKKAYIFGGGLQHRAYCETYIGKNLLNTTEQIHAPYEFNQKLVQTLPSSAIESEVLKFIVYKKKWTSKGYKEVGSLEIPLIELKPLQDKGTITKDDCKLVCSKRNVSLSGKLSIDLILKDTPYGKVIGMTAPQVVEEKTRSETIYGKVLGLLIDFDNKFTDRKMKLLFILASIAFLALNYRAWTHYSGSLVGIESRLAAVKRILQNIDSV